MDTLFKKVEQFKEPSTILFRSIELKLLKKTIDPYISGNKRILDLGCGEGIVSSIIFDKQVDYGLDTDKKALEYAKKRGIFNRILLTNARKISLRDNSVDIVFSNSVLEHIPYVHEVLKEVSRVLKPNGLFIFTTISNQFENYTLFQIPFIHRWWGKARNTKFEHYHTYSLSHWIKLLHMYDFSYQEGYYYISPGTVRFWELLLFVFYIPIRTSKFITRSLYQLFRRKIITTYKKENKNGEIGAALCIVVRKNT